MALEYTIYCDSCGTILAASRKSAAAARKEAQQSNWAAVRRGNKDLCGECDERESRSAAKQS